jgi:hypothetical protein
VGSRSKARARAKASQARRRRSAQAQVRAASEVVSGGPRTLSADVRPAPASAGRQPRAAAKTQTGPAAAQAEQLASAPRTVLAAAAVQAAEALGVLAASVLAGIDTASGRSYELASGVAITIIGAGMAVFLGLVANGLRMGRRWSRTPAVLTQLFVGIVAIYLLQAARYDWGVPFILLAVAGLAMILAPASIRVLTPGRPDESERGAKSKAAK